MRSRASPLEIKDHGKWISAEKLAAIKAQRPGVGITGMRERVRHLKGEMDIQSNGTGARILVTLPLPPVPNPDKRNVVLMFNSWRDCRIPKFPPRRSHALLTRAIAIYKDSGCRLRWWRLHPPPMEWGGAHR